MSTEKCSNHEFSAGATEKLPGWEKPLAKTDMLKKCVERYYELANTKTEQLYKVSTILQEEETIHRSIII